MTIPPRTRRKGAVQRHKRAAIVEAALQVFAEVGVEATTVRAIAARAGYTPGALYSYFDDKDALVNATLALSLGRLLAALRRADRAAGKRDAVVVCARAFRDYYRANPAEFVLLLGRCRGRATGVTGERTVNGRLIALLAWIESRRRAGPASDGGAQTVALFAKLCGLVLIEQAGWLTMLGFDPATLMEHELNS